MTPEKWFLYAGLVMAGLPAIGALGRLLARRIYQARPTSGAASTISEPGADTTRA